MTSIDNISTILLQECQLFPQKPVIIGVSGGPDSLCLMDVLLQTSCPVVICHLDHQLRAESGSDAEFVRTLARARKVPCIVRKADVKRYAAEEKVPIEEAARILRYRFLFDVAKKNQAQAVAVGHHADDQVETVLMHFLRGTGLEGLLGLQYRLLPNPWSKNIPLVRPLLGVWRDEIIEYVRQKELTPVYDISNRDTTYLRNRIRHALIPELETYAPRFRERIWRMSRILKNDYDYIEQETNKIWSTLAKVQGNYVTIQRSVLVTLHPSVKSHLILKAIRFLKPDASDVGYQIVSRLLTFINRPTRTRQDQPGLGLWIRLEDDEFVLTNGDIKPVVSEYPQMGTNTSVPCEIPGSIRLENGWSLRFEMIKPSPGVLQSIRKNRDARQAWAGTGEQPANFYLRTRKPGDGFPPLGLNGKSVSLKKYMINKKIPRHARKRFPLVCSGNKIVWIPGYQLSDEFRVGADTAGIVKIVLIPPLSRIDGKADDTQ